MPDNPTGGYELTISRRTIDKLGVELYDKVSAVVAELIANSYDADAERVLVRLPLNTLLTEESPYAVEVEDDGCGMSPEEAQAFYLHVGADRRHTGGQGPRSRNKHRPVTGRKGIGKLAAFGVCKQIEVLSAGGARTENGYEISHFFLKYDKIASAYDAPVHLDVGPLDRTFRSQPGTTVRLARFLRKRTPNLETFLRQIARRFGPTCAKADFAIEAADTREEGEAGYHRVSRLALETMPDTRIDLADRPVTTELGETLPVVGWLAFSKSPLKNEETSGVAIYARGKIVATTRDFEQPAGFAGEFATRSYLVGEVEADWLDATEGEDLVRTDRQNISWDSVKGRALRSRGAALIKEIARRGRHPRRERVRNQFLDRARIEDRAKAKYADVVVVEAAVELAKSIGGFAAEDELEDEDYLSELAKVILSLAPYKALIDAFRHQPAIGRPVSLDDLLTISGKVRVAELAAYAQIAWEHLEAISQLEAVIDASSPEAELQRLIATTPWLIEPSWSVITANETLRTFARRAEAWMRDKRGLEVSLAVEPAGKRPDFICLNVGNRLTIVEIKAPGYQLGDDDGHRLSNYVTAFRDFFSDNQEFLGQFAAGWRIELIADGVHFRDTTVKEAYASHEARGELKRSSWQDFLLRARLAHEDFLNAQRAARKNGTSEPGLM